MKKLIMAEIIRYTAPLYSRLHNETSMPVPNYSGLMDA
jgi:hypothetical protein